MRCAWGARDLLVAAGDQEEIQALTLRSPTASASAKSSRFVLIPPVPERHEHQAKVLLVACCYRRSRHPGNMFLICDALWYAQRNFAWLLGSMDQPEFRLYVVWYFTN